MQQLVHPDWDSRKTSLKKAEFCQWKMDNGREAAQVTRLLRPTLLLTTAGLERWAMENGEGSPPAAHPARDALVTST